MGKGAVRFGGQLGLLPVGYALHLLHIRRDQPVLPEVRRRDGEHAERLGENLHGMRLLRVPGRLARRSDARP